MSTAVQPLAESCSQRPAWLRLGPAQPSPVHAPKGDAFLELLCFRAAGQEYGLPLPSIQEIRHHQGSKATDAQRRAVLVLAEDGQRLGLVVDEVLDVQLVAPDQLRQLPSLHGDLKRQHLRALVRIGKRHVLQLDPAPWFDTQAYVRPRF
ncbi:hypothetical protein G8A07_14850 [Roseateles sp. DAIF2]|uniref:chemotaxis protein CheW n=1 Tax=Roseateles sp. DAIF2 TaxID=2714952 RepID=UPI0018A2B7E6|nr:chemotaxis protein CheW [Roseateles sp. DAIF2]QPF74068.1 hypothetical protein G8A07_14850 [Roseateles sp. DAIF2]